MLTLLAAATVLAWSSSAPPHSPAEAVAILRASRSDRDRTGLGPAPLGPRVVVIGTRGPDGPWDWPTPVPARRLDGRSWAEPDLMYGQPYPWLPPGAYPIWYPGASVPVQIDRPKGSRR